MNSPYLNPQIWTIYSPFTSLMIERIVCHNRISMVHQMNVSCGDSGWKPWFGLILNCSTHHTEWGTCVMNKCSQWVEGGRQWRQVLVILQEHCLLYFTPATHLCLPSALTSATSRFLFSWSFPSLRQFC